MTWGATFGPRALSLTHALEEIITISIISIFFYYFNFFSIFTNNRKHIEEILVVTPLKKILSSVFLFLHFLV